MTRQRTIKDHPLIDHSKPSLIEREWLESHRDGKMKASSMENIREYAEGHTVEIRDKDSGHEGRPTITAYNEGGCNLTIVDVLDLLVWIIMHRPEWIKMAQKESGFPALDKW